MKDLLCSIVLIISLCALHTSTLYFNYKDKFNVDNVMKHITDLSSETYKGRLAGTKENEEVENYIEKYLSDINLLPFTKQFKENFTVNFPDESEGNPFLQIKNGFGEIHKTFKYNVDFREDFLNFKVTEAKFTLENIVKNQEKSLHLSTPNGIVIFYEHDIKDKFRSSFIENSDCSLLIFVTKDTLLDIKKALSLGMSMTIKMPYQIKEASVNNLSGKIEGVSDSSKIVFTSHFDHLGQNILGEIYPGALDGASGTAFLLELSRFLKPLPKPVKEIVFVHFNAEEFGLLGSQDFVYKNTSSLINSSIINLDMIGGQENYELLITAGKDSTSDDELVKTFSEICIEKGVNYSLDFNNSEDHASFSSKGIDAITISDSIFSRYHTPEDKEIYIDKENIKVYFNVVWEYLMKNAYKDNVFLKYDDMILLSSIIIICVILAIKSQKEGFY